MRMNLLRSACVHALVPARYAPRVGPEEDGHVVSGPLGDLGGAILTRTPGPEIQRIYENFF